MASNGIVQEEENVENTKGKADIPLSNVVAWERGLGMRIIH